MKNILFLDLEVDSQSRIRDIGAWIDHSHFHDPDVKKFQHFLKTNAANADWLCGHNIFHHDLPILKTYRLDEEFSKKQLIDTLYLSALLFPHHPYHKLVKDYKLVGEEPNNPVSDCKLTLRLFKDLVHRFQQLDIFFKTLYFYLLKDIDIFRGFFIYLNEWGVLRLMKVPGPGEEYLPGLLIKCFKGKLCINTDFQGLIKDYPLELAYALALFNGGAVDSISPPWLVHRYPAVIQVSRQLRCHRCPDPDCTYCNTKLDPGTALKNMFGFEHFRRFDDDAGISLQEQAV